MSGNPTFVLIVLAAITLGGCAATAPESHLWERAPELQVLDSEDDEGRVQEHQRPYTIDDVLSLQRLGQALEHDGFFTWEQGVAYGDAGSYGAGVIGAWSETGYRLHFVDTADGNIQPAELFEAEPGNSYKLLSMSPSGRFVLYYRFDSEAVIIGAFDRLDDVVREFDQTPLVEHRYGVEAVWISETEFAFAAHGEGELPVLLARPASLERLVEHSDRTWGGGIGVSVSTTPAVDRGRSAGRSWLNGGLYRANAETGVAQRVGDGQFRSLKLSANGRYLAGLRQARLPHSGSRDSGDWIRTHSELTVFDLTSDLGPFIPLEGKNTFIESVTWSPTGHLLAAFAWDEDSGVRAGRFHVVDASDGHVAEYFHGGLDLVSERERGFFQKPERAIPTQQGLLVFAREHDGADARFTYRDITAPNRSDFPGKGDWILLSSEGHSRNLTSEFDSVSPIPVFADDASITVLADGNVWRIGLDGSRQSLTSQIEAPMAHIPAVRFSPVQRSLDPEPSFFTRTAEGRSSVLLNLDQGEVFELAWPDADYRLLASSQTARTVLFGDQGDNGLRLVLAHPEQAPITLVSMNDFLAEIERPPMEYLEYEVQAEDGSIQAVDGCMMLPAAFEPGRRYPVIVEVYPSLGGSCPPPLGRNLDPYSLHLLAAEGYIVFRADTDRGVIRTNQGPLSGMPEAVLRGVEALIEQGYADPNRIGLLGGSQGGFSSLYIASQTDIFDAVVSLNGWSDMYSHYFSSTYLQDFYTEQYPMEAAVTRYESEVGTDFSMGVSPFEDPQKYIQNSPLLNAPQIHEPVLLIHSDRDVFPISQYQMMYTALHRLDRPARLVRYWGEGHAPSSPGNLRHMWTEILDWYDTHLGSDAQAEEPRFEP